MKKIVTFILLVCMIISCCACAQKAESSVAEENTAAAETEEIAETETAAQSDETQLKEVDYAAMYALHNPDDVVMKVDGKDVTWAEYFYPFYYNAKTFESYMQYYAMLGAGFDWADDAGDGTTYAESVPTMAEYAMMTDASVLGLVEENGVEMNEKGQKALEERHKLDLESVGAGTTEEQFQQILSEMYLTPEVYEKANKKVVYYDLLKEKLFGENGEKITDEEINAWINEHGYMGANHILLLVDETMDEAKEAEIKEQSQALADELKTMKDASERTAKFLELKEKYDEDTGKTYYPEGYVFQTGEMVEEFENAVKEMKDNEVSDPVKSAYGYHVIMKIPVTRDSVLDLDSEGNPQTVVSSIITEKINQICMDYLDTVKIEYVNGFKPPLITDFIK